MPISFGYDPARHEHEVGTLEWARRHHADYQGLPVQPEFDATGLGHPAHDDVNLNHAMTPEQQAAFARYQLTDEATFDPNSGDLLALGGDEFSQSELRDWHHNKVIQGMEDYSD